MRRYAILIVTLLLLGTPTAQLAAAGARASGQAVEALTTYLAGPADKRSPLAEQREFDFGIFLALFGLACAGCALLGTAAGAFLS